jgi:hypothetical protein
VKVGLEHALLLTCWPYGYVFDVDPDSNRVFVAMVGDHVPQGGGGAGCRVWLVEDLTVVHRPSLPSHEVKP